jgi:uncharacterized protein (DUF305 family)
MSTIRVPARLAVGAALSLSLLLTGCGAGSTTAGPGAAPTAGPDGGATDANAAGFNAADVRFAQMMVPHHRQAVEMAELAPDRAERPEVRELAEQIRAAQDPEIATMARLLQAWGDGTDHSGMDHSGMGHPGMAGMMTPEQMQQLEAADGAAFDALFLQLMIAHHEGAVADAQRELAEGVHPEARELASAIVATQRAEIDRMRQLSPGH